MEQPSVRKTFKEQRRPTPAQERAVDEVLWRCRALYHTALQQRITAWQRGHVCVSRVQQEAELKEGRAAFPEDSAIHSPLLQAVLARLDKTYQAFFRRIKGGEQAGFPRCKGRNRFHSFTLKEFGNGAALDNGFLVLSKSGRRAVEERSKSGRMAVHWRRPIHGTPKTITISREADGRRMAGMSRCPAPMGQSRPSHLPVYRAGDGE